MGNDIGDINNDGLIDVIVLDMFPDKENIRKQSGGEDDYELSEMKKDFGYYPSLSATLFSSILEENYSVKSAGWQEYIQQTGVGRPCSVTLIMTDGKIFLSPMEYTGGLMIWTMLNSLQEAIGFFRQKITANFQIKVCTRKCRFIQM